MGFGGRMPDKGGMTSIPANHRSAITSSVVNRYFGSGFNILRITDRHSRGTMFDTGGGVDDDVLYSCAYDPNEGSFCFATRHGSSWYVMQ